MAHFEHEDEACLLADVARGDGAAFGVLYRRYLPVVVRWCWLHTGDRELAADLSAEVFAAALQHSRRYRPEKGPPVAWLLGIARNKLLESRRCGRVESAARKRVSRGLHTLRTRMEDR
jgi:DNA-directed RNA polymerase specialized sigma24 family protein